MFDQHKALNVFYDDHVRLGIDRRSTLAGHRDSSVERLKNGLQSLGLPLFVDNYDQGSYAMHTLNQHRDNEYDIDEALIFEYNDLPSSPLAARQRIEEAFIEAGGNFKTPPEAKANAVRVHYAGGYHIDFAIYRRHTNAYNQVVIEHAGPEWLPRNPTAITDWFMAAVRDCSPSGSYVKVSDNQLRRVVRFMKAFAKSRSVWNLPGGLIISSLCMECYKADANRDDVALYDTMVAIHNRLQWNTTVLNPVDLSLSLTGKHKYETQVSNLSNKLKDALDKLAILNKYDCDEENAKKAWGWLFLHEFWGEQFSRAARAANFGEAAANAGLFVAPNGNVSLDGPGIQPPPQRFYGDR